MQWQDILALVLQYRRWLLHHCNTSIANIRSRLIFIKGFTRSIKVLIGLSNHINIKHIYLLAGVLSTMHSHSSILSIWSFGILIYQLIRWRNRRRSITMLQSRAWCIKRLLHTSRWIYCIGSLGYIPIHKSCMANHLFTFIKHGTALVQSLFIFWWQVFLQSCFIQSLCSSIFMNILCTRKALDSIGFEIWISFLGVLWRKLMNCLLILCSGTSIISKIKVLFFSSTLPSLRTSINILHTQLLWEIQIDTLIFIQYLLGFLLLFFSITRKCIIIFLKFFYVLLVKHRVWLLLFNKLFVLEVSIINNLISRKIINVTHDRLVSSIINETLILFLWSRITCFSCREIQTMDFVV